MKCLVKNIVCFLFVATNFIGYGQSAYYRQYTEADGLPSMTTYEMIQDSSGLLWMGTENGLVSFDGLEFTTYSHPELKDNDIIEISLSWDGSILFFNLSHQLGKVVDGEVEILLTAEGQRQNLFSSNEKDYVSSKIIEANNQCYRLFELNDTSLTKINEDCLLFSDRKTIVKDWKNSYSSNYPVNRVFHYRKNGVVRFFKAFEKGEKIKENKKFESLIFDGGSLGRRKNNFYFGEIDGNDIALLVSDEVHFIDERLPDLYDRKEIQRVVVFGDNNYVIKHNSLEVFNSQKGKNKILIDDIVVNTVFEDNENQLWISTRNRGLLKINQSDLKIISFEEIDKIITGIYSNEEELLIVWEDQIEVRNKSNERVKSFDLNTNKQSTVEVFNNAFLISSFNSLFKIESQELKLISPIFMNAKSLAMMEGKIIGGNFSHLGVYELNENISFNRYVYLTNVLAIEYFEDEEILLVGTSKGLFKFDKNFQYQLYAPELSSISINDIIKYKGFYWIASKTDGLFKVKDEKIIYHFDTSNGLLSDNINDIAIQGHYIYAATTKGISQINTTTNNVVTKNSFNGLPSDHISDLCIFNDSIWMANQKDVVIIDSSFFKQENATSTLAISEIYCNNEEIEFKGGMAFDHDQNKIDIILDHISLSSGSNKSIKYRMTNADTVWTTTREAAIRLPSLKPGKYNLEIVGVNAVGSESKPLNLGFSIGPPWWETTIARATGLLLLFVVGYIIILYRGRRIRKEETIKRDYLNQINSIKDQALQLQMNPHFIFNSLNAIQGFIGTNEEEKAMNFLARFARLIRLIFEHSKGNTISLEEELEFIRLYLDLEKLRFKDKVEVNVEIDEEIEQNKDMLRVPPLLIQPIVENSFKHGLFHKKGKGKLSISYSIVENILKVIIEDNGIGRAAARRIVQKNSEKNVSSGIKTTQERIDLLNFGKNVAKNSLIIEDLYLDNKEPAGTKTTLCLQVSDN